MRSRGGKWLDSAHNVVRDWLAPLDAVAQIIPEGTRVLDIGCGQGLLMQRIAVRCKQVIGIDIDPRKCDMARERLAALSSVEVNEGDAVSFLREQPAGTYDAVIFCDTLSGLPVSVQDEMIVESARLLNPGGQLIIKFMDTTPVWKWRVNRALFQLIYRVLKVSVSHGQNAYYRSSSDYLSVLTDLGLSVSTRRLHEEDFSILPHVMIVGKVTVAAA